MSRLVPLLAVMLVLNVKTPSDTLNVNVRVGDPGQDMEFKLTGSVASAGLQDFTRSDDSPPWSNVWAATYYILIEGTGSGSIVLEAKNLIDAGLTFEPPDTNPEFYFISSEDPYDHIPKTYLYGHEGAIPQIAYGDIISRSGNGSAYAAGERIEILYMLTHPVNYHESLTMPFWLGSGAQHRRKADLYASVTNEYQALFFTYTVQPTYH